METDNSHNNMPDKAQMELGSQEETQKQNGGEDVTQSVCNEQTAVSIKTMTPRKAKKRGIFVSYSPDAGFEEKRLISYTIKELKADEIGFANDLWFDKDDCPHIPGTPFCHQQRLEIAEKCRAVLVFYSESYKRNRLCRHEMRIFQNRNQPRDESDAKPVRVFCVNYDSDITSLPSEFESKHVDLNSEALAFSSIAAKASEIVGTFSVEMEKYAPLFGRRPPSPPNEGRESFMKTKICLWDVGHVQDWLNNIKILPRFCLSFEENMIDGFSLLSVDWCGCDLENHLMVDIKPVAKHKMEKHLKGILEKQEKDQWYERIRKVKPKEECVYIISDPLADKKFAKNLEKDLLEKHYPKVCMHKSLGQSKEDFLQANGGEIASASHVVMIMSEASATSVFVYSELMFADWLKKDIIALVVKNSWEEMRTSAQAILYDCDAVDFENSNYKDGLDILLYYLRPPRKMPPANLDQQFLDKMEDGLKKLRMLVCNRASTQPDRNDVALLNPKVFLSYHWGVQTKVERLADFFAYHGFDCCTDVSGVTQHSVLRTSPVGNMSNSGNAQPQNEQDAVCSKIKSSDVVVSCITPKYICSDNCIKDLKDAVSWSKPIIPLMFQWMSWPPEIGSSKIRKILAPLQCIDLSNDKQFRRNQASVVTALRKISHGSSSPTPREQHH